MTKKHKNLDQNPMQKSFSIGHALRHNFDWPNVGEVLLKVKEELTELEQSLTQGRPEQVHELGDLLFTIVQVARHLDIPPDDALDLCNQRHHQRMEFMKKLAEEDGLVYESLTLDTLETYWVKAKTFTKKIEAQQIQNYLTSHSLSST
ncbi:MAG: hypothetical protein M9899_04760 [Bdellovibrionaceae bacterium]|nr:hypothetical protein [Pseudobdellovibrionaceae bacterium]